MPKTLPLIIAGEVLSFTEGLHVLDGTIALDDGQIIFAEGIEQTGEFSEELGQIARGTAASVNCHNRVHSIVPIGGQIEPP